MLQNGSEGAAYTALTKEDIAHQSWVFISNLFKFEKQEDCSFS